MRIGRLLRARETVVETHCSTGWTKKTKAKKNYLVESIENQPATKTVQGCELKNQDEPFARFFPDRKDAIVTVCSEGEKRSQDKTETGTECKQKKTKRNKVSAHTSFPFIFPLEIVLPLFFHSPSHSHSIPIGMQSRFSGRSARCCQRAGN